MEFESFQGDSKKLAKAEISPEQLNLLEGKYASMRKVEVSANSAVAEGHVLGGKLLSDVKVGGQVEFEGGGQTSAIEEIFEEGGKVFIKTATSKYELVGDSQGEDVSSYESKDIEELLSEIEEEFDEVVERVSPKWEKLSSQMSARPKIQFESPDVHHIASVGFENWLQGSLEWKKADKEDDSQKYHRLFNLCKKLKEYELDLDDYIS